MLPITDHHLFVTENISYQLCTESTRYNLGQGQQG
jgi:hypothetical protein